MRLVIACLVLASCGRIRFEPLADGDGGVVVDVGQDAALSAVVERAYIKASNTGGDHYFGLGMALSADGSTLAVGAPGEASASRTINGNQEDTSAPDAGAVYVFRRSGTTWVQEAYVKASNADAGDFFGITVSLSRDGSTLAVGAYLEDSGANGINGNAADNGAPDAGAVYVFTRSGSTWSEQAYLKASNSDADDRFGNRLALSEDGTTLAVGAYFESSAATTVDGNEADNSASAAGATYVFTRSGTTWSQQAYLKAANCGAGDLFGYSFGISKTGDVLVIGAMEEDSAATGIDANGADDSAVNAGAAYVFTRSGTTWTQQAYLKASNSAMDDVFGVYVALSADASTIAVGAFGEASNATGIDGDQTIDALVNAGAVYVFGRIGISWEQRAYVKASNTGNGDQFGACMSLSADGSTLVVGANRESSTARGINGDQNSNGATRAGAAYVFTREAGTWSQRSYVKASNTGANDEFGLRCALSAPGGTLVVSALQEQSSARGIGGDGADNSLVNAGAVYVYE